eukprot:300646_1
MEAFLPIIFLLTLSQSLSPCIKENIVVHDYNITENLINDGWTRCYFEAYSSHTSITQLISHCPYGDDYYVFVGALSNSTSPVAYIGAFTTSISLISHTASKTNASIPFGMDNNTYHVYWYNFNGQSLGFSSESKIDLSYTYGGDVQNTATDNDRLSWSIHSYKYSNNPIINYGGYRAGVYVGLQSSSIWRKIIYYKQCNDIVTPTPTTDSESCIAEQNVVHDYHIHNNLISQGWQNCYDTPYTEHTNIRTLITSCPIGDDYFYFIGAKSNNATPLAYIGAFAPSVVTTQVMTSTTTAIIPFGMNESSYHVHLYNYIIQ